MRLRRYGPGLVASARLRMCTWACACVRRADHVHPTQSRSLHRTVSQAPEVCGMSVCRVSRVGIACVSRPSLAALPHTRCGHYLRRIFVDVSCGAGPDLSPLFLRFAHHRPTPCSLWYGLCALLRCMCPCVPRRCPLVLVTKPSPKTVNTTLLILYRQSRPSLYTVTEHHHSRKNFPRYTQRTDTRTQNTRGTRTHSP